MHKTIKIYLNKTETSYLEQNVNKTKKVMYTMSAFSNCWL